MSKRRIYFHVILLVAALVIGCWSFWQSGFWMEGRNKDPNFTFLSMILLVISQGIALKTGFTKDKKTNH